MEQGAGPLKTPGATRRIIEALAGQHPNADTELVYHNAFELLVATVLTLIVTPAALMAIEGGRNRRLRLKAALASRFGRRTPVEA